MYSMPYMSQCKTGDINIMYKTLDEALILIKQAIMDEKEDELFYDYLISVAPTDEEKEIIKTIRDDEKKHNKMFKEIYKYFTGEDVKIKEDVDFEKPDSYIDGIKKALFGELGAVERYRNIRAGIPNRYYKDMVFEILTDEQKHADKYNYILNINSNSENRSMNNSYRLACGCQQDLPKKQFNMQEAKEIADVLGIDFNREKFDLDQFRIGLNTELEHGKKYYLTDVTMDNPITTGKIALAHLREFPDYYIRLMKLEEDAKNYWGMIRNISEADKKQYTPDEWVMYIEPLVKQALLEYKQGINLEHLFQEFILSGVLVGLGKSPKEAINQVEIWENTGESKLLKKSKTKK